MGLVSGWQVDEVLMDSSRSRVELNLSAQNLKNCGFGQNPPVRQFTLDMLEARVENAMALKLHRAKRFGEAAVGFKNALRLDPRFALAVLNLGSTLSLANRQQEALAALAQHFDRHVVRIYIAMHEDPDLKPLLGTAGFAALKVVPAGTASLPIRESDFVAYSAKYARLAVTDVHDGLQFYSTKTGELDAVLNLGNIRRDGNHDAPEDGRKYIEREQRELDANAERIFAKRQPLINRLLADLGFVRVEPGEHGESSWQPDHLPFIVKFPKTGFRFLIKDPDSQIFRQDRLIRKGNLGIDEGCHHFYLLPSANVAVCNWTGHGSADCMRFEGTQVLPLADSR